MSRSKNDFAFYDNLGILDRVPKSYLQKQILHQILKKPPKIPYYNNTHWAKLPDYEKIQQADLLYLPHDGPYKYALVCVEINDGTTDAVPLVDKTADSVTHAFRILYEKHKILSLPNKIILDSGSEFKGSTAIFFKRSGVVVQYGKPERSKTLGYAEIRNKVIGNYIYRYQYAHELITKKPFTKWTKILPHIINKLNEKYHKKHLPKGDDKIHVQGNDRQVLEVGDKVRVVLDKPRDVFNKKLHGSRFRATDIRYDPTVRTITKVLFIPSHPIMYKVSGIEDATYVKGELSLVHKDEQLPPDYLLKR